ncbi:MAG: hypothetical protein ABII00_03530 [Elusimicrobiota bacterium]
MTKWKTLFLGPVVYVVGLVLMLAALVSAWRLMLFLEPYLPSLIAAAEVIDDHWLFWFVIASLPAVTAGLLAAPPEGPGRWAAAFGSGLLSTALLVLPAAALVWVMLPGYLDHSAGSDTMMGTAVIGFFAAGMTMSGLGGLWRYKRRHALSSSSCLSNSA